MWFTLLIAQDCLEVQNEYNRDVSFQAIAWIQAFKWSPNFCTFIYFEPVLEAFHPDSHTFSAFFLQVSLHPWYKQEYNLLARQL